MKLGGIRKEIVYFIYLKKKNYSDFGIPVKKKKIF